MATRISLLLLAILLASCATTQTKTSPPKAVEATAPTIAAPARPEPATGDLTQEEATRQLRDLLNVLDQLITTTQGAGQNLVRDTHDYVKAKAMAGELVYTIPDSKKQGIYLTAGFTVSEGGQPVIAVDRYLLRLSRISPSLVLSIIVHESKHAYDYFHTPNFLELGKNPLEKYLYEMDSAYLEALFIRDYASRAYGELSSFERFLLTSLQEDDLETFSLNFCAYDMGLTYYLLGLNTRLEAGSLTPQKYLEEIIRVGSLIHERPVDSADEGKRYAVLVGKLTFNNFVSKIIGQGFSALSDEARRAINQGLIDKVNDLINKTGATITAHAEQIETYTSEFRAQHNVILD